MRLRPKGFPKVNLCFNYLTGNSENTKNDDLKLPEWQHVESQSSLQPHLSNILIFAKKELVHIYFLLNNLIVSRNAKFVDIMRPSMSNYSWFCSTNWCFWCLSTSNKCNFSHWCYVSSSRYIQYKLNVAF